jgi:hypothetical protein
MRPPAVEKLGYYPTSIQVIEALKSWIAPATEIEMARAGVELVPAGRPAAPTRTTTFDAWMGGRGNDILNSNRKKKVVEGQMSLFDLVN